MPIYNIGDLVPDLTLSDAQGDAKPLSELTGERGILVFLLRGTWCPSCVMQIRVLQRYYRHYVEQGVNSVFVTAEDPDSIWTFKISQARPLPFGLHPDPTRETIERFIPSTEVGILPATYLLDREGRVVWRHMGQHAEDRPGHQQLLNAMADCLPLEA